MREITTIFWDVGGVLLTNGWDRPARRGAAETFEIEWEEFQERHHAVAPAFETGQLGLDDYLQRTVFHRPRAFTGDRFRDYMLAQSKADPETIAVAAALARSRRFLMATVNNESLDLNQYRIEKFGLRDHFSAFFSSCFLGVTKPDPAIYRLVLRIVQRPAEECLFIDDRTENLESARSLGMRVIRHQHAAQLRQDLLTNGIRA